MKLTSDMMQRSIIRALFAAVHAVTALMLVSNASGFQQGPLREVISMPEPGAKPLGVIVRLSCDDTRLFGDIPVAVDVSATGKNFPADRLITVRISSVARTTQPPGLDCVYELPINLPEGSSSVQKFAYLPKWSIGGEFDVAVYEGRRVMDGYRGRILGESLSSNQAEAVWFESASRRFGWIVEDVSDIVDARVFFPSLMPGLMSANDITTAVAGFEYAEGSRQFRVVSLDQLPTDWRGFDAVDIWISDYETLKTLISKRSDSAKALNDYIRCGGTLWILGSVSDRELNQWFSLRSGSGDRNAILVENAIKSAMLPVDYEVFRGTNNYGNQQLNYPGPRLRRLANTVTNVFTDAMFDANVAWINAREIAGRNGVVDASDFVVHDIALGRVVVCSVAKTLPGTPQQWRALASMSNDPSSSKISRRAVDPCFGDRRFWDWVIPGVAQPPVYTFIGLLIVFVIVVGPLAYRKLTRLGRGYLMMFFAPLMAFATTLIMFAYGLVADGLSTRVRVREVTWIGDTSGVAARCNRATYFAGVRPSDGMRFPANSIVMPYQLSSVTNWYRASELEHSTIGVVEFTDDAIRFDPGFLPSRQQKQFVTYRPVEKVGLIRLGPVDSQSTPTLVSELNMELRQGVVRGFNGDYFSFDRLPAGATITPKPEAKASASKLLSELYGIQRPLPPAGISSAQRRGDAMIDMMAILYNDPSQMSGTNRASLGDSSIEAWLRDVLQIRSELPPGMFVAVADVTADCIAVDSAELVESVHYVIGVLP